MTTDLIDRLREADPVRDAHRPTAASAVALRERITATPISSHTPRHTSRAVRWGALAAAGFALAVAGATVLTSNKPRQASAKLVAAIDATSALASGQMKTTMTDTKPSGVSTMTVRFDGPDWSAEVANPNNSGGPQRIESRHVDGTTYGRFGDEPWSISDGSLDVFDADRFLAEQANTLDSLTTTLQPCSGSETSFCGESASMDTINGFLLVDLGGGAQLESASIRIDTADGLVQTITIHITRIEGDPGLTIVETYSHLNQPQNIEPPIVPSP